MKRSIFGILFAILLCFNYVNAQTVAVKTNALYWVTTTPNLAFEVGLGKHTTLDFAGGYNPWTFDKEKNTKVKHWMVQPEFRYWLCERFNGHFFGIHSGYTFYNVGGVHIPFKGAESKNNRYQGWATGAGISYGYSWVVGDRWNIEATLGIGWMYTKYDRYECKTCGKFEGTRDKHFFGPTKAAVSVIYIIK